MNSIGQSTTLPFRLRQSSPLSTVVERFEHYLGMKLLEYDIQER